MPAKRTIKPPPTSQHERAKLAAVRDAILSDIKASPTVNLRELAALHGVSYDTAYKVRREYEAGNEVEDRAERWGRLLSAAVPLRLRAKTMRDLVKSNNPVAAARALEMVLESDGLRKKASEPKRESVIVVQAGDDVTFE